MSSRTSFLIDKDGYIWASGFSNYGQAGNSSNVDLNGFVKATLAPFTAKQISVSQYNTLQLNSDGSVWALGGNYYGQRGTASQVGTNNYIWDKNRVELNGEPLICSQVISGRYYSLFITTDDKLYACGVNSNGQLGIPISQVSSHTYIPQLIAENVVCAAAGFGNTLFVKSDGTTWVSGTNSNGQLGTGNNTSVRDGAIKLDIPFTPKQISTAERHTLFLDNNGDVWGCGRNSYGQLADLVSATGSYQYTPKKFNGISNVVKIIAAGNTSYFLTREKKLYTCGYNNYGQAGVGINNTGNVTTVTHVRDNVDDVAAGYAYCVTLQGGRVTGVGANHNKQQGTKYLIGSVIDSYNRSWGTWYLPEGVVIDKIWGNPLVSIKVENLEITPTTHSQPVSISADVSHVEGLKVAYTISINGEQVYPVNGNGALTTTPFVIAHNFDSDKFNLGSNTITIQLRDEGGGTLSSGGSVEKTNEPPTVTIELDNEEVHNQDVNFVIRFSEPENDRVQYKVFLNDVQHYPDEGYSNFIQPNPATHTIPNEMLVEGANSIKVEVLDEYGGAGENTVSVTKVNKYPTITGELVGNRYTGIIDDEEKDSISYRVLVNGEQLFPDYGYTSFEPVPADVDIVIPKSRIIVDSNNILEIEIIDSLGGVTEETINFLGQRVGLLFCDANESFYTTELGEILRYLDFGTLIAGQTSFPEQVFIKNMLGYSVENLRITKSNGELDSVNEWVELSESDAPFLALDNITFTAPLSNGDKIGFYVRVVTTKEAVGGGMFEIAVRADPVRE